MISRAPISCLLSGALLICTPPAYAADSDLLVHYKFDETAGTKAADASGRGFDGTCVNQPGRTKGVNGGALKLSGGAPDSSTASYVEIPNGVLEGLSGITVATWVKWDGEGAWQWLFGLGLDPEKHLFVTLQSAGNSLFGAIKDGVNHGVNGPAPLEPGTWHHLALTSSAETGKLALYLDGEKLSETDQAVKPAVLFDAAGERSGYIGKSFFPDPYFAGEVDDFRIYSKALTSAEVGDLYGEAMPADEAVALVKENLGIGRAVVTADIALPKKRYGADIRWKSNQPAVVSDSGKVKRPAAGRPAARAVLTATIRKGEVTATKSFNVDVLPVDSKLKFESYNPILKTDGEGHLIFTADPAVMVDGDTLYLYAGQDEAAIGGWFAMNQWVCYSTKDMVTWKYEGVPIKATDFSWGTPGTAWACQVVKKGGKYYFFSTSGRPDGKGYSVGVAVSDKPTGPFVDVKKAPVFENAITTGGTIESFEDIDPTVFIDDDGQAYLYWGNSHLYYALLTDDLMSLKDLDGDGRITEGKDVFPVTIGNMEGPYGEAPWLHKANGRYYLVYAGEISQQVRYAMADSPRGPWQYKGVIAERNLDPDGGRSDVNADTNHPAVAGFKGQWYLFHHTGAQPSGGQTRRSVHAEKLFYNPDGTIRFVPTTSTGLTGTASRIQSFADKDQFIRFENFDVKVERPGADERPFQWEITLGLADEATADTVSIQCVSHPGHYLRVEGDKLVLAKNDNTREFKRAATFRRVAGLADRTGTSFQPLADSTRFLRQSGDLLTVAPVSAASSPAEKQDATFKIR